jgi:hypothetical protein
MPPLRLPRAPRLGAFPRHFSAAPSTPRLRRPPLRLSGALASYQCFDVTPVIGTEFVDADLAAMMQAPNAEDLVRDLAITGSHPPFLTYLSNTGH